MKGFIIILLIFTLNACSFREKGKKLEKGTPDYEMAVSFAQKVPALNPDANMVILTTRDFEVTVGDVIERMRSRFGNKVEQLKKSPASSIIRLYKELAQSVAYTKIMLDAATKEGIVVTAAHVDSVLNVMYQRNGGEEKYLNYIYNNGATMESLRRDIRVSEIQRLYLDKRKMEKNPLTEAEIDSAMKGDRFARIQHILMMFRSSSDSAKMDIRKKMEVVLKRARAGEDFAKLAKEFSEDPGSKDKGGLIENVEVGFIDPAFQKAVFNLPIGQISDLVETKYGYHILKVLERKQEDRPRNVVVEYLKNKRKPISERAVFEELAKDHDLEFATISEK